MTDISEFSDFIKAKFCPSRKDFIRRDRFLPYCNVPASQKYFQCLIYLNAGQCCGNSNNLEFPQPLSLVDPIERCLMTQVTKITLIKYNCLDQCWANPRIIKALSLTRLILIMWSKTSSDDQILFAQLSGLPSSHPPPPSLPGHLRRLCLGISSRHVTKEERDEVPAEAGAEKLRSPSGAAPWGGGPPQLTQIKPAPP